MASEGYLSVREPVDDVADWTGLLPMLAFVLTVGASGPVALAAHLLYRAGGRPFARVLRISLLEAGLFYLLGVSVLWSVGLGISRTVTLLVVGAVASVVLVILPLLVGRRVVRTVAGVDSETALRHATYGWPLAMLAVFGIFVLPGGIDRVTFFHVGGVETCLLGFCGLSAGSVALVLLQSFVAFLGPGLLGVVASGRIEKQ